MHLPAALFRKLILPHQSLSQAAIPVLSFTGCAFRSTQKAPAAPTNHKTTLKYATNFVPLTARPHRAKWRAIMLKGRIFFSFHYLPPPCSRSTLHSSWGAHALSSASSANSDVSERFTQEVPLHILPWRSRLGDNCSK